MSAGALAYSLWGLLCIYRLCGLSGIETDGARGRSSGEFHVGLVCVVFWEGGGNDQNHGRIEVGSNGVSGKMYGCRPDL